MENAKNKHDNREGDQLNFICFENLPICSYKSTIKDCSKFKHASFLWKTTILHTNIPVLHSKALSLKETGK